jgi:glyoxylase-like metal-dependent hydrolase (beta-lactamase superfamily II)
MMEPALDFGWCRLQPLAGNTQRLDGGAMFGNAPKALWSRWLTPDAENRVPLACRALLVTEADGRRLLFETGIGAFFDPRLKSRYGVVEERHVLLDSLAELGLTDADIDLVVLSHLHFDHAGGLLSAFRPNTPPRLLFPNARILVSATAWARARSPHRRDRASFIPEITQLLDACGRLQRVGDSEDAAALLGSGYRFLQSHGHTPGLLLTEISAGGKQGPLLVAGDLVPGKPWMHLPIAMGYDRFPELLIEEKEPILRDLLVRSGYIFFTHDPETAIARVVQDERGRFVAR